MKKVIIFAFAVLALLASMSIVSADQVYITEEYAYMNASDVEKTKFCVFNEFGYGIEVGTGVAGVYKCINDGCSTTQFNGADWKAVSNDGSDGIIVSVDSPTMPTDITNKTGCANITIQTTGASEGALYMYTINGKDGEIEIARTRGFVQVPELTAIGALLAVGIIGFVYLRKK